MPETSSFEVRCERCKTSFAIGTRVCVHCGGAIGRRVLAFDAPARRTTTGAGAATRVPNQPDAQPGLARLLRFAVFGLIAVTAVARACIDRN